MADVRLTATNPEDSSVVPVACNAKGELKLEEIPDQSFDGNLDGNLTVTGNATFAGGNAQILDTGNISLSVDGTEFDESKNSGALSLSRFGAVTINLQSNANSASDIWRATRHDDAGKSAVTSRIKVGGSAEFASATFADRVQVGGDAGDVDRNTGAVIRSLGLIQLARGAQQGIIVGYTSGVNDPTVEIKADGSAAFAGNKAGFTTEGYLWCTTRRGDTVILDATSNGLASWVEYTPPSRREQIKDAWSEKNAIDTTDVKFPSDPSEKPTDTQ